MINTINIGNTITNPVYNTNFLVFCFKFKIINRTFKYRNDAFFTKCSIS